MSIVAMIQFWAPYRGHVNVTVELRPGMNIDWAARYTVKQAISQFERKRLGQPNPPWPTRTVQDRSASRSQAAADWLRAMTRFATRPSGRD